MRKSLSCSGIVNNTIGNNSESNNPKSADIAKAQQKIFKSPKAKLPLQILVSPLKSVLSLDRLFPKKFSKNSKKYFFRIFR